MFKTKFKTDSALPPSSVSIIGAGNTFTGDLDCNGDLRIDGIVKGSIYSKAKVIVGLTGFVEGDIHCNEADITGKISGNIFTKAGVVLKQNATVHGDLHTPKLIIEPSATFNGKSFMGEINLQSTLNGNREDIFETPEKSMLQIVKSM
ncbi:MAG: polymer-forming cytoskeletal protein [Ferruginibacter sp.]